MYVFGEVYCSKSQFLVLHLYTDLCQILFNTEQTTSDESYAQSLA